MATFAINPESGVGAPIRVRGTINPDATGYYYSGGKFGDWRCFGRHDEAFWIWSDSSNQHFLTVTLGDLGPGWWSNSNPGPLGKYETVDTYTGIPTVSMLGYHNPFGVGITVQQTEKRIWKARRTGRRLEPERRKLSKPQRALARAVKLWHELSPAMQLIWVGDGSRPLTNREFIRQIDRGMRRWIQVQMPLLLAGFPPEASTKQRIPYQIDNVHIGMISFDGTEAVLRWRWNRASLLEERVVLHVSQLRPKFVWAQFVWQFARLIGSFDYTVQLVNPGWQDMSQGVSLRHHPDHGETIQLYVRFELMDNPNPPVSKIGSLMTTEDWTDLRFVRL